MAQRQYDIPAGRDQSAITSGAGTAIGTSVVRVTVDGDNAGSRENAIWALKAIILKLARDPWPPT